MLAHFLICSIKIYIANVRGGGGKRGGEIKVAMLCMVAEFSAIYLNYGELGGLTTLKAMYFSNNPIYLT
jgi:hypothetical protein